MQVFQPQQKTAAAGVSLAGRWLAACRRPHAVDVWDRTSGERAFSFDELEAWGTVAHPAGRLVLAWGPDGLLALDTATLDKSPVVADVPPLAYVSWVAPAAGGGLVGVITPGRHDVLAGWTLAEDGALRPAWQVRATGVLNTPYAVSPAGRLVAVQTDPFKPSRVRVHAAADGSLVCSGAVPERAWLQGVFDAGTVLLKRPRKLTVWDLAANQPLAEASAAGGAVLGPDGRLLSLEAGGVAVRDPDTLAVRRLYALPVAGKPCSLAVAPDGLTAACGTGKGELAVWNLD